MLEQMDESQLSVTKKRKMDNPKPKVEKQGKGEEEAQIYFDAAITDREKIEVGKFDGENSGNIRKLTEGRSTSHKVSEGMSLFGCSVNSLAKEISESRMLALNGIMEALKCSDINTIGVCGPDTTENANLLEKVSRRAKRDNLFDVVVMASVTQKPNNKRVQDEIAEALGFKFDEKALAKRAKRLRDSIIKEQRILAILGDLCEGLDLDKVGIPFGADHPGCKVLLHLPVRRYYPTRCLLRKFSRSNSCLGRKLGTRKLWLMVIILN